MLNQLTLFPEDTKIGIESNHSTKVHERSGTFVDNMKLPIHRWFRFSAGFSAGWVEQLIQINDIGKGAKILDPFAGSGTTLLASDMAGVSSVGIEAHPFIFRIAKSKLLWETSIDEFKEKANEIFENARNTFQQVDEYPDLIHRCFPDDTLQKLDALKKSWLTSKDETAASELIWLAITAILRPSSTAGTAQWQYILPNRKKKVVKDPFYAFKMQIEMMANDMFEFQSLLQSSQAEVFLSDARYFPEVEQNSIDMVVTSPPYANNYDYADAVRFEMSFWGYVRSWGDLHRAARKKLIVSSSQHASKEKLQLDELLESKHLASIKKEITDVCVDLSQERLLHGGKKHYHTMIAAYFVDMSRVWTELRRVCKPASNVYFVIGDSAPYGVYVPVDRWLGELAIAAGFQEYQFEKLRDRNIKWKNRKHRVPLHEGILKVRG